MSEVAEEEVTDAEATEDEEEGEEGDEVMTEDEEGEDEEIIPTENGEGDQGEEAGEDMDEEETEVEDDEKEKTPKEIEKDKPKDSEALKGKIDDNTMKELMQIEREAKEIADEIHELKLDIEQLLKIETMTEKEEKELEEKNTRLNDLMLIFDDKTKRIQEIIATTNILDNIPTRITQEKHEEDVLPRVILCGIDEEYVPKIVVCHQKVKGVGGASRQCLPACPGPSQTPCTPNIPKEPSFNKVDRSEELEKIRLQLERDISDKNRLLEQLQLKLENLQTDIHNVAIENAQLNDKIRRIEKDNAKKREQPKGICPTVLAARLKEYGNYTRKLERTVAEMEEDFDRVHKEICAAIKARDQTSQRGNMAPPCRRR